MRSLVCKTIALLLLLPMAALMPGCSLTQGEKQQVSVITDKPAQITVDGTVMGETKGEGQALLLPPLERKNAHLVEAKASDGWEARGTFDSTLSALGVLDTIGIIFILPAITLITGHAFELTPDPMRLTLAPPGPKPPAEPEGLDKQ
jgi:hypothetical protein